MAKKNQQQEQTAQEAQEAQQTGIKPEVIDVSSGKAGKLGRDNHEGCSKKISIEYKIGSNLQEAIDLFGEDVVFTNFRKGAIVVVQARARNLVEATDGEGDDLKFLHTDASVKKQISTYRLETQKRGQKSEAQRFADAMATARAEGKSPEEIRAILDEFGYEVA